MQIDRTESFYSVKFARWDSNLKKKTFEIERGKKKRQFYKLEIQVNDSKVSNLVKLLLSKKKIKLERGWVGRR